MFTSHQLQQHGYKESESAQPREAPQVKWDAGLSRSSLHMSDEEAQGLEVSKPTSVDGKANGETGDSHFVAETWDERPHDDMLRSQSQDEEKKERHLGSWICGLICLGITGLIVWAVVRASAGGSGGSGGGGRFVAFFHGGGGSSSSSRSSSSRGSSSSSASCFPLGERIELAAKNSSAVGGAVRIEELQVGAEIANGGRVTAVMKLLATGEPMYRYNDSVFVTGSHLVHENDKGWIPVGASSFAQPRPEHSPRYVYNLVTENHQLTINGTLFSDWEEWDDTNGDWGSERDLLARLNHGNSKGSAAVERPLDQVVGEGAFDQDTTILLEDGTRVSVHQLQPGSRIHGGATVNAVMKVWIPSDTVVYRYMDAVVVTEWTIVYDNDGIWRNVRDSLGAVPVAIKEENSNRVWYQLWTTSNQVVVNDIAFADYYVFDDDVNGERQQQVTS